MHPNYMLKQSLMFFLFTITIIIPPVVSGETEELAYFDLEENPEIVKEKISKAFWENPLTHTSHVGTDGSCRSNHFYSLEKKMARS